jgi:hypothetical protein
VEVGDISEDLKVLITIEKTFSRLTHTLTSCNKTFFICPTTSARPPPNFSSPHSFDEGVNDDDDSIRERSLFFSGVRISIEEDILNY